MSSGNGMCFLKHKRFDGTQFAYLCQSDVVALIEDVDDASKPNKLNADCIYSVPYILDLI